MIPITITKASLNTEPGANAAISEPTPTPMTAGSDHARTTSSQNGAAGAMRPG